MEPKKTHINFNTQWSQRTFFFFSYCVPITSQKNINSNEIIWNRLWLQMPMHTYYMPNDSLAVLTLAHRTAKQQKQQTRKGQLSAHSKVNSR